MLDFLRDNYPLILQALTGLIALGVAIAKVTPTKTDDEIVSYADKGVNLIKKLLSTGK